jgi:hypothetical protein
MFTAISNSMNNSNAISTHQRTSNNTYMYGFLTFNRENFPILDGSIYINEVARDATPNYPPQSAGCRNNGWIELIKTGNNIANLARYIYIYYMTIKVYPVVKHLYSWMMIISSLVECI